MNVMDLNNEKILINRRHYEKVLDNINKENLENYDIKTQNKVILKKYSTREKW